MNVLQAEEKHWIMMMGEISCDKATFTEAVFMVP